MRRPAGNMTAPGKRARARRFANGSHMA